MFKGDKGDTVASQLATRAAAADADLRLMSEAFAAVEHTLDALLEALTQSGALPHDSQVRSHWERAIADLRARGLPARPLPGTPLEERPTCPKCGSVSPKTRLSPGDICGWCGHSFVLCCPGCKSELPKLSGLPGEACPFCRHEF